MKLKTLEELKQVAEVRPPLARDRMSKRQRLARWAEALERAPQRYLRSLFETEYMSPRRRYALREDNSPLTVAFEDPVLRAEGLEGCSEVLRAFRWRTASHRLLLPSWANDGSPGRGNTRALSCRTDGA